MPFLRNGGIFIPTEDNYELGEEVFVLLGLMEEADRHPVTGRVVWISPRGSLGSRPAGIGIQFDGPTAGDVNKRIETYLAGYGQSDQPTHTM